MLFHNVVHSGAGKEILLSQPQQLALLKIVIWIQNLADDRGGHLGIHGAGKVSGIKEGHIKGAALCLKQTQQAYPLGIKSGYK